MAIGDAVISGKRSFSQGTRNYLPVNDPGAFVDFAKAYKGDLRRINDSEERFDALLTQTADGDG